MKIRNGFVSNSSSSSFVIALSKNYKLSDKEISEISDKIEDYDEYFEYYEDLAEKSNGTEVLDEREKINKMLESNTFTDIEEYDPVNDDVKNEDIRKGFELLTTKGYFWYDEFVEDVPTTIAAKAIFDTLSDKVLIGSLRCGSSDGQIINILASAYEDKKSIKSLKEYFKNENL